MEQPAKRLFLAQQFMGVIVTIADVKQGADGNPFATATTTRDVWMAGMNYPFDPAPSPRVRENSDEPGLVRLHQLQQDGRDSVDKPGC